MDFAPGTPSLLRPMLMTDLIAVTELDERCQPHPWGPANFQGELLRQDNGFSRIVLVEETMVGYLCTWMVLDELHIGTIGVDPTSRRSGWAKRLMREAHAWAKGRGGTIAHLEVRAGNVAALELYQGLGYRRVGRRKAYYPDNQEDALLLLADL